MNVLERKIIGFYKYIEDHKLKQSEISRATGFDKGNVSKYYNNKLQPSEAFIQQFEKEYNISLLDYLKNESSESIPKVVNNNVSVPYYDVDFAGGWDSDEMFSNQLPAFYITSPDFAKAEFSCNLVGNSISNRIPSGAIIGLREIFNWQTYFPTNELYGVLTKNDLRTVKIVKRSKTKGFLTLMPDPLAKFNHTGYEPEEIPIEFVARFYQVVAWACFEKVAM